MVVGSEESGRNLFHYIASLGKPETIKALIEFLTLVFQEQEYDKELPWESLQNQVALDKDFYFKKLLTQVDKDNLMPVDILLFRIGERIREWPETEMSTINEFCSQWFLDCLSKIWAFSPVWDYEEPSHAIICFIKGLYGEADLMSLESWKEDAAQSFLRKLTGSLQKTHGSSQIIKDHGK